jgi:LuxR family maltose regulon positive regulatory protein
MRAGGRSPGRRWTNATIGESLFISPHTVKSQAISICRKLGVSSRGAAIEAARAAGML